MLSFLFKTGHIFAERFIDAMLQIVFYNGKQYNIGENIDTQQYQLLREEVLHMATSSIFTNIVIGDPKKVEDFVNALEMSGRDPAWKPTTPVNPPLTDINKIRKLMAKKVTAK